MVAINIWRIRDKRLFVFVLSTTRHGMASTYYEGQSPKGNYFMMDCTPVNGIIKPIDSHSHDIGAI